MRPARVSHTTAFEGQQPTTQQRAAFAKELVLSAERAAAAKWTISAKIFFLTLPFRIYSFKILNIKTLIKNPEKW